MLDTFLKTVKCDVLLDDFVVHLDVILSVASKVVYALKTGEEWRHINEEHVGQQSWSPLLELNVAQNLCQPAKYMDTHHNFCEISSEGLLLLVHFLEGLHRKHTESHTSGAEKSYQKVAPDIEDTEDKPLHLHYAEHVQIWGCVAAFNKLFIVSANLKRAGVKPILEINLEVLEGNNLRIKSHEC